MAFLHCQNTAGQLRNRKSSSSGGAKVLEQADVVTFADVAGVDEAKEELEEIVVCEIIVLYPILYLFTFVNILIEIGGLKCQLIASLFLRSSLRIQKNISGLVLDLLEESCW